MSAPPIIVLSEIQDNCSKLGIIQSDYAQLAAIIRRNVRIMKTVHSVFFAFHSVFEFAVFSTFVSTFYSPLKTLYYNVTERLLQEVVLYVDAIRNGIAKAAEMDHF